jgi:hypothetical protein
MTFQELFDLCGLQEARAMEERYAPHPDQTGVATS